ncbi:MAG: TonB-dependent receptor plug domain-containing protein [Pseudomonadota bacterium]
MMRNFNMAAPAKMRRTRALKSALFLATAVPASFFASQAAAQVLGTDEIIVTAQKREENVQEVGISVTAFTGDAIREFGFADSTDIIAQVPGLNVGTPVGEGNNPSFTLRGVGLNDFNDNNEGPIAVYIDDVYQAALPGLTFQLFDTERVEVLRGPQGTLYGRNATGGLIHFISRRPTDELTAFLEAETRARTPSASAPLTAPSTLTVE